MFLNLNTFLNKHKQHKKAFRNIPASFPFLYRKIALFWRFPCRKTCFLRFFYSFFFLFAQNPLKNRLSRGKVGSNTPKSVKNPVIFGFYLSAQGFKAANQTTQYSARQKQKNTLPAPITWQVEGAPRTQNAPSGQGLHIRQVRNEQGDFPRRRGTRHGIITPDISVHPVRKNHLKQRLAGF